MGDIISFNDTLVALFDIQAYSEFIEGNSLSECISKMKKLLPQVTIAAKTDINGIKTISWVFSDTVIFTIDTNIRPLNRGSLRILFAACSVVMDRGMHNKLPLRGAIGGGNFYKEDQILISTALSDAAKYEKYQEWLGIILTPNALSLIKKYDPNFENEFSTDENLRTFVKYGPIPWKEKLPKEIVLPKEYYYLKPCMEKSP
jgi:hypothetical protein